MHSQNEETTPLLRPRSSSVIRGPYGISPTILITPVLLAGRFALLLPITTTIQIVEAITCQLWYQKHFPDKIPEDSDLPEDMCSIGPVKQSFAAVMTFLGIMEAVGILVSTATTGYFATRYGRKPVMLTYFGLYLVSMAALITAQAVNSWVAVPLLLIWIVLHCVTDSEPLELVVNMFVVDVVAPEERTAFLSKLAGWGTLGLSPSFVLGGIVSSYFRDVRIVFYLSTVTMAILFLHVLFLVPESFPKSKRDALEQQRAEERSHQHNPFKRLLSRLLTPFEGLRMLKPMYNPATGRKSWRLVWAALHTFISAIAQLYSLSLVVVYLTTERKFSAADTGLLLTCFTLACVVVLLLVVPTIRRILTRIYTRNVSSSNETSPESESPQSSNATTIDVQITFWSWVICAVAMLCVGWSTTKLEIFLSLFLWALAAGRLPVFKSLVASSVDPVLQGEALSAIQAVFAAGGILSPIIMGGIFTSTVATAPLTVFYVHGIIVLVAASFLFLIKEEDRITGTLATEGDRNACVQG